MRKYKAILLTLIISIVAIIGFIIYNNYFIKWNEVEKYIDKYMTYQVVLDDDIERITKETYTKENYDGTLYKSFYKNYPDYEYQYFYSGDYYALHVNKVMLQAYHEEDGSKLQKIIKN
ncbi:DUF3139 domain-containing protein [Clostridioides difficile]|nr:DUF3139 domain-containing protein [Clostridioides difficile]EGT4223729.1 DUF3139 domain-containing protein [Clostridioides difficile]